MGPKYESGTRNHSRKDAVVTKRETEASSPTIFHLDSKHESKSSTSSDSILNESVSGSSKTSELSCSTFSTSSGYSSDDFIVMNPKITSNSISSNIPPYAKALSQRDYNDLKLNNTTTSSAALDASLSPTVPITKCPTIQVMERQGDYDPNRVPSSVFESKCSTPNEWSGVSDESLFSINVSLSMNHGDPRKSEELHRCFELDKYEEISKSGTNRYSSDLKEEHTEKSSDTKIGAADGNNLIEAKSQHKSIKKELHLKEAGTQHKLIKKEQHFEEEIKLRGNGDYSTALGHSERNGGFRDSYNAIHHSNGYDKSLAFPTDRKSTVPISHAVYHKKKKSKWRLCSHSYCSCGSCCSRWSSCCCKSPGCFSCKWSNCCCKSSDCFSCNWSSCCCKSSGCFSCKWSNCCCKSSSCFSCKWSNCCCKSSGRFSCKWSNCCCKPSSCFSCKWLSWSCCSCKWLSWSCCCPKWSRKQIGCCK